MISVAIMGHGTVGSGVAEILTTHKQKLFKAVGEELYVKHILDLREFPDSPLADRFTKNFEDIVNDIEVRVVVEVMGGTNPAYDFVKRCLQAGKSVVTSNKELVAKPIKSGAKSTGNVLAGMYRVQDPIKFTPFNYETMKDE